ncbi:hypothetical protein [Sphingomicrobium sediminis]|uniref:Uncharacterized protein n=1 Tax=Sphingomicrobium sediminis TaxID=2950949 RepID=A0A9X2EEQ3_9SPHN|nr:hypothetical protein [Sphingomicrobium sediminis]MCM8556633.1 hypothetical protein [Sphingomicrobium sediminis]
MTDAAHLRHPNATPTRRIALFLCLAYLPLFLAFGTDIPDLFSHLMVLSVTLTSLQTGRRASYDIAVDLSTIFVIVPPYFYDALAGQDRFGVIVAASYLFLHFFRSAVAKLMPETPVVTPAGGRIPPMLDIAYFLFLVISIVTVVFLGDQIGEKFGFSLPLFMAALLLERQLQFGLDRNGFYVRYGFYAATFLIFVAFFWTGFGRLMLGVFLVVPVLVANRYMDVWLRSWQVGMLSPFLLIAAHRSRFSEGGRLTEDSGTGHYLITWEMIETADWRVPRGWEAFFDQFVLLWLQWVPRAFWPDKPIGLGRSYVEDWMGRQNFSEGHSIATGLLGEQLWLLGPFLIFGFAIVFASILALRAIYQRLSPGLVCMAMIFDAYLTTYLWGGMASFGGRIGVALIPLIFFGFFVKRLFPVQAPPSSLPAQAKMTER